MLIALGVAAIRAPATLRRMSARTARVVQLPPETDRLLRQLRLRSLEVRVHPGIGGDRCYRRLGRAWISISGHTDHDEQRVRFVLWHEAAHLARRDSRTRIATGVLGLGLLAGALLSFDPRAMVAAGAGLPLVATLARWWSEAACDRLAVRRAGPAAMRAWATELRRTAAALKARGLLPMRRRYRNRLTHPPMSLRTALHARR
jgi:hypothetical protein